MQENPSHGEIFFFFSFVRFSFLDVFPFTCSFLLRCASLLSPMRCYAHSTLVILINPPCIFNTSWYLRDQEKMQTSRVVFWWRLNFKTEKRTKKGARFSSCFLFSSLTPSSHPLSMANPSTQPPSNATTTNIIFSHDFAQSTYTLLEIPKSLENYINAQDDNATLRYCIKAILTTWLTGHCTNRTKLTMYLFLLI